MFHYEPYSSTRKTSGRYPRFFLFSESVNIRRLFLKDGGAQLTVYCFKKAFYFNYKDRNHDLNQNM